MEKLLNIKELAERLGISHMTAYHWLSEGRLKCVRFSKRCVRFRESDIEEMVHQLTDAGRNLPSIEQLYTKVLRKQQQR
jgi:excisionase family DNA binding protein